jgi:acyl transferase domain-containing protein/acyl carrier protein
MAVGLRDDHVAVVGMACKLPGANTPREYWRNLAGGVESIVRLSEQDLLAAGVEPREFRHPQYVNAAALIDEMEWFDARFFGYTPREAQVRDPQGRLFLETCYAAVEDSGYDVTRLGGLVGVFGGMANNRYGERYVARNAATKAVVGDLAIDVSNGPDYLATAVSYRLGFRGPSLTVQTACSTALVAVHIASQALRNGECDYALAGAVEVELPYGVGYTWVEGGIDSRTGHIRPFDADACGTLFGSGVGVVALKRLGDALADGDHIYGVIRGSAVNNDGSDRAGFTAPSVSGQAQLVVEALAVAEVHPDSIGFVEAHATGTLVGDPIEIAGLTRAFRAAGATAIRTTPIGSVKANVGHLGPAAGMAGLIKACLALRQQSIPPHINFTTPNPSLELDTSPFYVPTELTSWPRNGAPRRAGVSSFGIGGTNAHLIVEEAPPAEPLDGPRRRWHVLPVSAKTTSALESAISRLSDALSEDTEPELADIAYTLQVGRTGLPHRRAVIASSAAEAAHALEAATTSQPGAAPTPGTRRRLVMMFPGQGTLAGGVGRELRDAEPAFREALDECAGLLRAHLDLDLTELLFPATGGAGAAQRTLRQTRYAQPALFAVEYAMARLLASAGLEPAAMIGQSTGELVAAHLAGVFSLADATALVAARARLVDQTGPVATLTVRGPEATVAALLPADVDVVAVNGLQATALAGSEGSLTKVREFLVADGYNCTEVKAADASHSRWVEPGLAEFAAVVAGLSLHQPRIPFMSNVTGDWIRREEATDPAYWARQLGEPVRLADGFTTLGSEKDWALVEVGPGDVLSKLADQCIGYTTVPIVTSMRQPLRRVDDTAVLAEAMKTLWLNGVEVDWSSWSGRRRRVPLPTYPFERRRYWVDPDPVTVTATQQEAEESQKPLPADRCTFAPRWYEAALPDHDPAALAGDWLVFASGHPVVEALIARLATDAAAVTVVRPGPGFAATGAGEFTVRPGDAGDLEQVLDQLSADPPARIVHALNVTEPVDDPVASGPVAGAMDSGFFQLLHLGRWLSRLDQERRPAVYVLSSNVQEVSGSEHLEPAKALLLGPALLMQRELAGVKVRSIDVDLPLALPEAAAVTQLLAEFAADGADLQVAWRGRKRWRLDYATVPLDKPDASRVAVRPSGTYLITGGLGGIGLAVAESLGEAAPNTVVLVGRSPFPPSERWADLIADPATAEPLRSKLVRLQGLAERGTTVVTAQCDVADDTALAELVTTIRERHGGISGVYHSAGVAGGGMMAVRGDADAAAVLAPKVAGTLALHRLLGDEVDFMVLFSSTISATGAFGQVDYCAASNFLDAFARWSAQRGRSVYSIGWARWNEFGMSTDTAATAPEVFRQLETGARSEPARHPLLSRRFRGVGDRTVCTAVLEPGQHWVTAEHRLAGQELLVGTALLEMVDGAYRESVGNACAVTDLVFIAPIGVPEPTDLRIVMRPDGEGHTVTVLAAPVGREPRTWSERARCRVVPVEATPAPRHDLAAISARCDRLTLGEQDVSQVDRLIEFGPHWHQAVTRMHVGDREELSRVELPAPYWSETGKYRMHPALLDAALGARYEADRVARGDTYLPLGYARVRSYEPLPPKLWAHLRHITDGAAGVATTDITLLDDDGKVLAEVTGYSERRVDPARMRSTLAAGAASAQPAAATPASAQPAAATPASAQPAAAALVSPYEDALAETGIDTEVGIDVLGRIMCWRPEPHLIVCPEGIHRSLRRSAALTLDVIERELEDVHLLAAAATGERPIDTPYLPPETDLQRSLARFWSGALGIAKIGLDDDFFDLGGDSLLAVQLAARMREGLDLELAIGRLFDNPTVRQLADYLARTANGRAAVGEVGRQ